MTNSNSNNKENYFDLYSKINMPLIDGLTHNETMVSLEKQEFHFYPIHLH